MEIRLEARHSRIPLLALPLRLVLQACGDDDGATTREAGSVVIIGPPPPGGGASVSAVGTGCTTKGATTKKVGEQHPVRPRRVLDHPSRQHRRPASTASS